MAGTIAEAARTRARARMRLGSDRPIHVPGDRVTRFQKLAGLTLLTAILLVVVGVVVRATDSGLGCPDWPLCHGQIIPPLDDPKAWIEWVHRGIAVVIGFEILGLAILALRDHRDRPLARRRVAGRRRPGRLPGVARPRDRPARQQRRVGHGAPRGGDAAGRDPRVPDGAPRLSGADRRPWREPAVHPPGRLRVGRDVRPAAVRLERHRDRHRARLPGLAADGRRAHPGPVGGELGPHPPSLGRGRRRRHRRDRGGRRLADPARPSGPRPAVALGGRPVRDPDRRRRPAGPDPAVGVDPDPAPRPRRRSSGRCWRA